MEPLSKIKEAMMINYPRTIEEARARRFGQWAGNPKGRPYIEGKCAYEVPDPGGWIFRQCSRKAAYGPGGLYCKTHAKRVGGDDGI